MDKGFFGSLFDFNHDGELDAREKAYDFMVYNELVVDDEEEEMEDEISELEDAGLDYDELFYMDDYERRKAIEEAGLDPDDFDF